MTEPTALSKLRHLYQNMVKGAVRDTASAKRIAEGLLAPAIEALEREALPAPAASQKPLTVGRIKEICRQHIARDKSKDEPNTGAWPDSVALARAVERAHGIGTKGGRNVDHPV